MAIFEFRMNGKVQDEIKANHFKLEEDGKIAVFFDKHDEKLAVLALSPGLLIAKQVDAGPDEDRDR